MVAVRRGRPPSKTKTTCAAPGCDRAGYKRGFCYRCYRPEIIGPQVKCSLPGCMNASRYFNSGECAQCQAAIRYKPKTGRTWRLRTSCMTCGGELDRAGAGNCSDCAKPKYQRRCPDRAEMRPSERRRCAYCDAEFVTRASKDSKCCSKKCGARLRRGLEPGRPAKSDRRCPVATVAVLDCAVCGRMFLGRAGRKLCGDACRRKHRTELMRAKYHADKAAQGDGRTPANWRRNIDRRARRLREAYVEDVSVQVLAERDGWRCHLCGKKVPKAAKWPSPRSASIDHLIPVSEGGEHSYRNTALAHLGCNRSKGTRAMGEQLRLIG